MNIWMQRGILLTAMAVILAICIPIAIYKKTSYKPTLTEYERAVVNFTPTRFEVTHKDWQATTLKQPLASGTSPVATTNSSAQLQAHLPPPPPALPPSLSFILQDGGKSSAIIGGNIVKTGDKVQGWQVERIERNRVLLRNPKGTIWLKLD